AQAAVQPKQTDAAVEEPKQKDAAAQPGPEEVLQQTRNRQAVEEQKMTQAIDDAIRQARRQLASDPDNAKEILKRAYSQVRDDPDLGERVRQLLTSRVETALRSVETQGARVKRDREEQLRNLADAKRRLDVAQSQVAEEERMRRRVQTFRN